ncbi:DUF2163 domain-containing protein [Aureimonas psammosilenae]|uniref:DUF2163 domain-containing protein n=1 Tax=Aureimonas psammosilenae TaxID=2495496 RepID=UPI001260CBED|nr:DUF2163 domain-containing protein [Aureimonas psammosilenae]
MRPLPEGLKAHLAGRTTSLCRCWRLTRRDGRVFGFTDHDEPIRFDGTSFEAASGLAASEAEAEAGLAAGTQEIDGALSSLSIEEKDIAAGRFDGARVESFLVNWREPAERVVLDVAELGEVRRTGSAFTAELRGMEAQLDRLRGRLYRRRCDARFGDERCGISGAEARFRVAATVVEVEKSGAVVLGLPGPVDLGLFEPGRIAWTSGEGQGLFSDIAALSDAGGGRLRAVPLGGVGFAVSIGDTVRLHAGCDKSFASCKARFRNGVNFRGFPHLPGNDAALAVAKGDGRHDGGPVVP